jgi:hypothetical protein
MIATRHRIGMDNGHDMQMGWGRFWGMIVTSTVVMFPLMYQLVYTGDHVTFSLTRLVSAVVMGAVMAVVMLAFMWPMYLGSGRKIASVVGAVLVAVLVLGLNRSQRLIGDVDFMKSMIPHHSIAINNARKAQITDPRVRELADAIIASQVREIREMQLLIEDIDRHGSRGRDRLPAVEAVVTPEMESQAREAIR